MPDTRNSNSRRPDDKRGTSARRGIIKISIYWTMVFGIWAFVGILFVTAWYAYDLPDVSKLDSSQRQPSVTLLTAEGIPFASFGDLYGAKIRVEKLPPSLVNAVIAIEDRRFYSHFGLDLIGLSRAAMRNIQAGRIVQGGSTITQQLAKNVFLTSARTVKRKFQETLLALWLEANFDKNEILTLYLNRVYFGAGAYGIDAAARRYFGKTALKLNLPESALLAGLLKAPSKYAPTQNLSGALRRARIVLDSMHRIGLVTNAQLTLAKNKPASIKPIYRIGRAHRYFADWIMDQLPFFIGSTDRDLIIKTTLQTKSQNIAEKVLHDALLGGDRRARVGQGAIVALDTSGAVRAMVGGRDYVTSQFNRITQARRQPGSAFKPIVYLAGLESGLTPESVMIDGPITVDGWTPQNYSQKYTGKRKIKEAIAESINTIAVKVSERAGRLSVADAALRLGIPTDVLVHPSIALGAIEVVPLDIAAAYATFANGGLGVIPHGVLSIADASGTSLYRRQGGGVGRVIAQKHAREMTDMLMIVIEKGTGRAAKLDRPAAGKTGTSQGYRDAWFIGYTPSMVAAVWFGNDNGQSMDNVTGGGLPAKTWREFMIKNHRNEPIQEFSGVSSFPSKMTDQVTYNFTGNR